MRCVVPGQDDRVLQHDLERVRALWRALTDAPDGFAKTGPMVIGSDTHRASPPGWTGIVELEGDVVVSCPLDAAERVRLVLSDSLGDQLIEPRHVDELLPPLTSATKLPTTIGT